MNNKVADILLVEDSLADIDLVKEAFEESKLTNTLHVVRDGVEAMAYLHQEGQYADVPRPDLILLDLNMPKKDGREVLAEIKSDDDLKTIPVVIMTTSPLEEDIMKSYKLHANAYIIKPVRLDSFLKIVQDIEIFWLSIVTLPPK
jgi:two-component system, chemotaxis family, response regulator Rcp1